jgi:hypothetical protein
VCIRIELFDELLKYQEMCCCGIKIPWDGGVSAYDLAILRIRCFLYRPDPGMPRVAKYVVQSGRVGL